MSPLPILDWHAALDEMADSLLKSLGRLEHFEADWPTVLGDDPPGETVAASALVATTREWESRLTAAVELADNVERELNDRQAEVQRWLDSFSRWRELIQQQTVPPDSSDRFEPTG